MALPRPAGPSVFGDYLTRLLLALAASLGLLVALAHLPLQSPVQRVGWSTHPSPEQIVLRNLTPSGSLSGSASNGTERTIPPTAPPVTDFRGTGSSLSPRRASDEPSPSPRTARDSEWTDRYRHLESLAELSTADHTPGIVGGVGSLYLHIDYPARAIAQGIEGTLELAFTVEANGRVTDLEVVQSLHPLCDSAAVAGVRAVRFVPARQEGTPVPIRLRLPVRFRLAAASTSP